VRIRLTLNLYLHHGEAEIPSALLNCWVEAGETPKSARKALTDARDFLTVAMKEYGATFGPPPNGASGKEKPT